tara:strand:- start:14183 stop:14524 length:342 start_codon:yes stop_codon:yes gene_type:complete
MKVINLWTRAEEIKLARIYAKFEVSGCILILKRTRASIEYKARQLGLRSPRLNTGNKRVFFANDIANAMELMGMGFDLESIAKCFNAKAETLYTVIKRAERLGIEAYPLSDRL